MEETTNVSLDLVDIFDKLTYSSGKLNNKCSQNPLIALCYRIFYQQFTMFFFKNAPLFKKYGYIYFWNSKSRMKMEAIKQHFITIFQQQEVPSEFFISFCLKKKHSFYREKTTIFLYFIFLMNCFWLNFVFRQTSFYQHEH